MNIFLYTNTGTFFDTHLFFFLFFFFSFLFYNNQGSDVDSDTRRLALSIRRYSVVPISHDAGLVGWVPNCDTLLGLITEYREGRGIPVTIERNLMIRTASPQQPKDTNYTDLTILQKVEVRRFVF